MKLYMKGFLCRDVKSRINVHKSEASAGLAGSGRARAAEAAGQSQRASVLLTKILNVLKRFFQLTKFNSRCRERALPLQLSKNVICKQIRLFLRSFVTLNMHNRVYDHIFALTHLKPKSTCCYVKLNLCVLKRKVISKQS